MTAAADSGSIRRCLTVLSQHSWWHRFREGRRDVPLIDDVLFVGHFYRWLQEQDIAIQDATLVHLERYRLALASFRPGARTAHERAADAVIRFFSSSPEP